MKSLAGLALAFALALGCLPSVLAQPAGPEGAGQRQISSQDHPRWFTDIAGHNLHPNDAPASHYAIRNDCHAIFEGTVGGNPVERVCLLWLPKASRSIAEAFAAKEDTP